MRQVEEALRCLAVEVQVAADGEGDCLELRSYLDETAGSHRWISASEWLFVDPPDEVRPHCTLPVVMNEGDALRFIIADLSTGERRVLHDHRVTDAEARRWRWLAFQNNPNSQGKGFFPWEIARG